MVGRVTLGRTVLRESLGSLRTVRVGFDRGTEEKTHQHRVAARVEKRGVVLLVAANSEVTGMVDIVVLN